MNISEEALHNPNDLLASRLASLAAPLGSAALLMSIRTDYNLLAKIEKTEVSDEKPKSETKKVNAAPQDVLYELLIKMGIIGPKPHDTASRQFLRKYIDSAYEDFTLQRRVLTADELDARDFEDADIVNGESALIQAFNTFASAEEDRWDIHYKLRNFDRLIEDAKEFGTFVVAQAKRQVDGLE